MDVVSHKGPTPVAVPITLPPLAAGERFELGSPPRMLVEICVDSVDSALAAERGGAGRVELCDNLIEGGTTPSAGCIKQTRANVRAGLHVMIRPRGGDFLYSPSEIEVMREDIDLAKEWGADGVVFGCLTARGDVDADLAAALVSRAQPMKVTFHRAFDMCRDPEQALEDLVRLGIGRVLTSGQESTCLEGLELIAALHRQARGRILVIPGGGVTPRNARRIVEATGVREIHLSARTSRSSGMEHRNPNCFMGGALRPAEYSMKHTDETLVRAVVEAVGG